MTKLEPEFKKKWIEALRSGNYKQATRVLYDPISNGFCCLGVAGSICGIPIEKMHRSKALLFSEDLANQSIPEFLKSSLLSEDFQRELVLKNDLGMPFTEIANYIEENL